MSVLDRPVPEPTTELPNEHAHKSSLGRWISWIILVAAIAYVLNTLLNNKNIDLPTMGQMLFDARILEGVAGTILLTVVAIIGASIIGVLVGYGRISSSPVVRTATWLYVWFFRSVPLVVFVLIFGNLALFLPKLGIGIPFTDISFFSVQTNNVMIPMVAGAIALTLEQGAYVAEIVRGGVQSVPDSQREAASSLGFAPFEIQRKVVLPQAIPIVIPALGSTFIILLKSTSLVFVIAGTELLGSAEQIASENYRTMELLFVASIWYLVLTSISNVGQRYLERRFSAYRKRVVGTRPTAIAASQEAGA